MFKEEFYCITKKNSYASKFIISWSFSYYICKIVWFDLINPFHSRKGNEEWMHNITSVIVWNRLSVYPCSRCKFGLTQMKGNQFSLGTPRGVVWLWLMHTPPSKHVGSKKTRLHIDATKPPLCCMWGNLLKQALHKRNSERYRTSLVYIFSWQWDEKSTMWVIGVNKRVVFPHRDAGAAKFMVQNKRQMKF